MLKVKADEMVYYLLCKEIILLIKTYSGIILFIFPHSLELKSVSLFMPFSLGNLKEVLSVI